MLRNTAFALVTVLATNAALGRDAAATLVGSWKGAVQFTSGDFAAVKDLELMYQFGADGTMMESSNYDASPPVPPAYGIWRKRADGKYEARYQFYQTRPVATADELIKTGGWSANGFGVITQLITLARDGSSFTATISLEMFDKQGTSLGHAADATAVGTRMRF